MEDISTNPQRLFPGSTLSIRGVEILATGTHNGGEYTVQDLDDMVAAFKELDFKPAVKLGHSGDKPGDPAYGWVENVRRVGEKLVADLVGLHESVYKAIRQRLYDRVSAEIYWNLERAKGGAKKIYRRALKAVALLGAEVPAVAGLVPLHQIQFSAPALYERAAEYNLAAPAVRWRLPHPHDQRPAVDEVMKRIVADRIRLGRTTGMPVEEELRLVLDSDPALAERYAAIYPPEGVTMKPDTRLNTLAQEQMRADQNLTYEAALDKVMADPANADLVREYNESTGARGEQQIADARVRSAGARADASKALADKANAHLEAHPEIKGFSEALDVVMADPANADLVRAYSEAA